MEELLFSSSSEGRALNPEEGDEEEERSHAQGRSFCFDGCGRPKKVCICQYLPSEPISTTTQIVILQHPHSYRHTTKLSTIPPLTSCLLHSHVIPSRRLYLGLSPLLDSLCQYPNPKTTTLFLFPTVDPSFPAVNIQDWVHDNGGSGNRVVLVVFDGTWRHAREMVVASIPFLRKFAIQVEVGGGVDVGVEGESMFESGLVLRKEPFKGCLSTMEAVARALRVLEKERGVEIEEKLLKVLRAMVGMQRSYLVNSDGHNKDVIKSRVKLAKKKKKMKENMMMKKNGFVVQEEQDIRITETNK